MREDKLGKLKKRYRGSGLGGSRGMTLIEALLALGILAIVAVVFLSAIFTAYKGTSLAQERTTAESLARTQVEAIKNAPYDAAAYSAMAGIPLNYDIAIAVTPLPVTPLAGRWQKVKVAVSHWGKGVFAVEGYKVDR